MDKLQFASNVVAHWVQSGFVAVAVLLTLRVLKVADPRLRLVALQCALVVLLVLPWVQPWHMIAPPKGAPVVAAIPTATVEVDLPRGDTAEHSSAAVAGSMVEPLHVALAVVATGIALRLAWLICGVASLWRFRRRARRVEVPLTAEDLGDQLGVRPCFVEHAGPGGPTTFGFFRPTIVLPLNFGSLDRVFQRSIVCHELLHVKRRDPAVALIEELVVAALWFHPWVWLLRSQIRVAREQVVDLGVVQLLCNRNAYVRCLVEMSGHQLMPLPSLTSGMLKPRELRSRVDAMFEEVRMSRARRGAVALMLAVVVGGTGWAGVRAMPLRAPGAADSSGDAGYLPLADAAEGAADAEASGRGDLPAPTFRSAQTQDQAVFQEGHTNARDRLEATLRSMDEAIRLRQAADAFSKAPKMPQADAPRPTVKVPFAEYPIDALEKGIRGTVHINLTISPAGDVTSAAVVEGPQELRASALKAAYGLKYALASSTTTANIGVVYSQRAGSWGATIVHWHPKSPIAWSRDGRVFPDATGAYRVGGDISQPRKIRHVDPVYPQEARDANIRGIVILETKIDETGHVSETRVVRSVPQLDQAAMDAVKQWQYEPGLVNGVAVPVIMTVTVNFAQPSNRKSVSSRVILEITDPAQGNVRATLSVLMGGTATIESNGRRFALSPWMEAELLKVAISDLTGGQPRPLGTVELVSGIVVQTPTDPPFGIQLMGTVHSVERDR